MEFRQLRYFVAVAEELHFGRAAEREHVSQPPLSQQIRKLEEEMDARLFDRTSRRVSLTPEGQALYEHARRILDLSDEAGEHVRAVSRGERGRLRLGLIGPAMESRLPAAIREYRSSHPDISLVLRGLGSEAQLHGLRTGDLDIGFIRADDHDMDGLNRAVFARDEHVWAVGEGHRLAGRARLGPEDLAEEPLILFPRSCNPWFHSRIMAAFSQHGLKPRVDVEVSGHVSAVALASAGLGIAPVPAPVTAWQRQGVVFVPDSGSMPELLLHAAWRKGDENPLLQGFLESVLDHNALQGGADDTAATHPGGCDGGQGGFCV